MLQVQVRESLVSRPDVDEHVAHRRLAFRLQLEARLHVLDALAQALEFLGDQALDRLQLNAQLLRDSRSNLADVSALRRFEPLQVRQSSLHLHRTTSQRAPAVSTTEEGRTTTDRQPISITT